MVWWIQDHTMDNWYQVSSVKEKKNKTNFLGLNVPINCDYRFCGYSHCGKLQDSRYLPVFESSLLPLVFWLRNVQDNFCPSLTFQVRKLGWSFHYATYLDFFFFFFPQAPFRAMNVPRPNLVSSNCATATW